MLKSKEELQELEIVVFQDKVFYIHPVYSRVAAHQDGTIIFLNKKDEWAKTKSKCPNVTVREVNPARKIPYKKARLIGNIFLKPDPLRNRIGTIDVNKPLSADNVLYIDSSHYRTEQTETPFQWKFKLKEDSNIYKTRDIIFLIDGIKADDKRYYYNSRQLIKLAIKSKSKTFVYRSTIIEIV